VGGRDWSMLDGIRSYSFFGEANNSMGGGWEPYSANICIVT
jgi:hypothetical protein